MVYRRKRLHRELTVSLAAEWPGFLTTIIANASAIERMGPERSAVATVAPRVPPLVPSTTCGPRSQSVSGAEQTGGDGRDPVDTFGRVVH